MIYLTVHEKFPKFDRCSIRLKWDAALFTLCLLNSSVFDSPVFDGFKELVLPQRVDRLVTEFVSGGE